MFHNHHRLLHQGRDIQICLAGDWSEQQQHQNQNNVRGWYSALPESQVLKRLLHLSIFHEVLVSQTCDHLIPYQHMEYL